MKNESNSSIASLLAAAAALPCMLPNTAKAQSAPKDTTVRFQYSYFDEWQEGGEDRMRIQAPQLWFQTPVAENWAVEGGFVVDDVSGASPLFYDTLTGASGLGIDDRRDAGDLTVSRYFERFSVSLGGNYSTEDDYDSTGGNGVFQYWSKDKNTTYSLGFNGVHNRVGSVNNPELDELRRDYGVFFGVTQVIDKYSQMQSNISKPNSVNNSLADRLTKFTKCTKIPTVPT